MEKLFCIDGINEPFEIKFDRIKGCTAKRLLNGLAEQWASTGYTIKWVSDKSFEIKELYVTYQIIDK